MSVNNLTQTTNEQGTIQNVIINEIRQKIYDAVVNTENISKEKYEAKEELIKSADNMTTQQKLKALDENYERRNQELWQNVRCLALKSSGVVGVAIGGPITVKNIRCFLSII